MRWQGIFRKLAYDGWNVYMVAREGHQELYKDYVKEYISAESLGFKTEGETDGWRLDNQVPSLTVAQRDFICPGAKYVSAVVCMQISKQEFIKFSTSAPDEYPSVIMHGRSTTKGGTEVRNWSEENWEELCENLGYGREEIGFIGTSDSSIYRQGFYDYRDVPLDKLCDILASAKLVVGPSSGPMHLASLCGTPHLIWTDDKFWGACEGTNRERYETNWNPHGTKAIVLDQDNWQPSVDTVEQAIKEFFNENR